MEGDLATESNELMPIHVYTMADIFAVTYNRSWMCVCHCSPQNVKKNIHNFFEVKKSTGNQNRRCTTSIFL